MEIWIGLAHVRSKPSNNLLKGAKGAFVQVVALSKDQDDFIKKATSALVDYGFNVLEIEDVEPWHSRFEHFTVDKTIQEAVESLNSMNPVGFGNFHAYRRMGGRRRRKASG